MCAGAAHCLRQFFGLCPKGLLRKPPPHKKRKTLYKQNKTWYHLKKLINVTSDVFLKGEIKVNIGAYVEKNYNGLVVIARSVVRNGELAQDILHSVIVALMEKQDKLPQIEKPEYYIRKCIYHFMLNEKRKESKVSFLELNEATYLLDSKENEFERVELEFDLSNLLCAYPSEMINAFVAHYLDSVPLEKIFSELDLTVNALTLRFKRMRDKLAKQIGKII